MGAKTKKIIKKCAIIVCLILVTHPILPIPLWMNVSAIEVYLSGKEDFVQHNVRIRGMYFYNIVTQNSRFLGTIGISGHDLTTTGKRQTLYFNRIQFGINNYGRDLLWYFEISDGIPQYREQEWMGTIYSRPLFRQMLIMVHDNGAGEPAIIVLRAASYEDAMEQAKATGIWY